MGGEPPEDPRDAISLGVWWVHRGQFTTLKKSVVSEAAPVDPWVCSSKSDLNVRLWRTLWRWEVSASPPETTRPTKTKPHAD